MNELVYKDEAVTAVREFEAWAMAQPQVELCTDHNFHAGCYARTILVPAGVVITGVQIKIDTLLIVSGDVNIGNERVTGYHVLQGLAGRKNAFLAHTDTWLTMIFASNAQTVEQAEEEFTDEGDMLGSRREG